MSHFSNNKILTPVQHGCRSKHSCESQLLITADEFIENFEGVLWNTTAAVPGAAEVIEKLKNMGKKIFYLTNNNSRARDFYPAKFQSLGFCADQDEIISSAYATAVYIKKVLNPQKKVYLIGSTALAGELKNEGIQTFDLESDNFGCKEWGEIDVGDLDPTVGCVVVGYDPRFNTRKISRAINYLRDKDCLFVASSMDESLLLGSGNIAAGTGAMVASVSYASGRQPVICGKPYKPIFELLQDKHKLNPASTLMIGDRLNTDIEFAHNCDLTSLFVLTGSHNLSDVEERRSGSSEENKRQIPDYYIDSIGNINEFIDS